MGGTHSSSGRVTRPGGQGPQRRSPVAQVWGCTRAAGHPGRRRSPPAGHAANARPRQVGMRPTAPRGPATGPLAWKQACTRVRARLFSSGLALAMRAEKSSELSPGRRAASAAGARPARAGPWVPGVGRTNPRHHACLAARPAPTLKTSTDAHPCRPGRPRQLLRCGAQPAAPPCRRMACHVRSPKKQNIIARKCPTCQLVQLEHNGAQRAAKPAVQRRLLRAVRERLVVHQPRLQPQGWL